MYQNCNSEEILAETTKYISLKEVIVSRQDVAVDKEGTTLTASASTFPEYTSQDLRELQLEDTNLERGLYWLEIEHKPTSRQVSKKKR